jgi:hypothetical protein
VELLARWAAEGKQLAHPLHEIVTASCQNSDEKRFLVIEEAIKSARGELCSFGDLLERGLVIALQPKDLLSCVQNVLPTEFLTAIASSFPLAYHPGWLPHSLILPARFQLAIDCKGMFSTIHLSLVVSISLFHPNVHQSSRPSFQQIALLNALLFVSNTVVGDMPKLTIFYTSRSSVLMVHQ